MKSLVLIFLLVVGCGVAAGLTREYILNHTLLMWHDAQSSCRKNYKDLATITTLKENYQLFLIGPNGGIWIGLNWTSDDWTWSDGEQSSFLNWINGSPYYPISSNKCGATSTYYPNFWVNYACSDSRSFYCYRYLILVQEKMTWNEAQEYCRTKYTGLASVTSETSLRQLNLETTQTQTESVWTGLRFMNGIWFWVSGEQLGSLVSMPSCPPLSYSCGSLNNSTKTLENRNCNDRLNFVCYWK